MHGPIVIIPLDEEISEASSVITQDGKVTFFSGGFDKFYLSINTNQFNCCLVLVNVFSALIQGIFSLENEYGTGSF